MDRADLYRVFELGGALHPLSTIRQNETLARTFQAIMSARGALQQLLGSAPQANVEICVPAATELKNTLDNIYKEYFLDSRP
jgi:hypothetical protein